MFREHADMRTTKQSRVLCFSLPLEWVDVGGQPFLPPAVPAQEGVETSASV